MISSITKWQMTKQIEKKRIIIIIIIIIILNTYYSLKYLFEYCLAFRTPYLCRLSHSYPFHMHIAFWTHIWYCHNCNGKKIKRKNPMDSFLSGFWHISQTHLLRFWPLQVLFPCLLAYVYVTPFLKVLRIFRLLQRFLWVYLTS